MATITQIRDGLVANLEQIDGLQALRAPVGNPSPPTAWVIRERTEYDTTFNRGTDRYLFLIQLLVGLSDSLDAQDLLDQFVAPTGALSIKQAIETVDSPTGSVTLGGLVDDVRVTEVDRDQLHAIAGQGAHAIYLATEFTVEVYAPGDE